VRIPHFKKIINKISDLEWLIDRVTIDTEYDEDTDVGIIGGSITFKDGSILHFKEVLLGDERHYRFHYMDARNGLIARWDTAPHHKDLKTFPYHVHLPDGVRESMEVTLMDVFDEIEHIVIGGLQDEEK
jgi:hypothetical protein